MLELLGYIHCIVVTCSQGFWVCML